MIGNEFSQIIEFEPPLPCGTHNGNRLCGKPATVGHVDYVAGVYHFLPICFDCTIATALLYAVNPHEPTIFERKDGTKDG